MTNEELATLREAIRGLEAAGVEVTVENAVAVAARTIKRLRDVLGRVETGATVQSAWAAVEESDALDAAAAAAYGKATPPAPASAEVDEAAERAYGH
jgi:hypothetical protein